MNKKQPEPYKWQCYYCCDIITGDRDGNDHKFECRRGPNSIQGRFTGATNAVKLFGMAVKDMINYSDKARANLVQSVALNAAK